MLFTSLTRGIIEPHFTKRGRNSHVFLIVNVVGPLIISPVNRLKKVDEGR